MNRSLCKIDLETIVIWCVKIDGVRVQGFYF